MCPKRGTRVPTSGCPNEHSLGPLTFGNQWPARVGAMDALLSTSYFGDFPLQALTLVRFSIDGLANKRGLKAKSAMWKSYRMSYHRVLCGDFSVTPNKVLVTSDMFGIPNVCG